VTVHLSDLPPAVRARIEAGEATAGPRARGKSRAGVGLAEPCPGTCGCGARFPNAAAWQRHADANGCGRWSIDLPGVDR
jgi:hypothetical protein